MKIIKSQTGDISECAVIEYSGNARKTLIGISINKLVVLGHYENETRATEVMEMIEEHIEDRCIDDMMKRIGSVNENTNFVELLDILSGHKVNAIFTMPKE